MRPLWPSSCFTLYKLSRSLSDIDLSIAANDVPASASFSAIKNPQRISANTLPVFRRLWPCISQHLLTKAMSDRLLTFRLFLHRP